MISAILKYSIGSLIYGGLITVIFLAIFIFLIKGWHKDAVFKPISLVALGVLALIIFFNSTIICGAQAMKSDISSIKSSVENIIESTGIKGNLEADSLQSNSFMQEVTDRYPIINSIANQCDISGSQVAQLPSTICDTLTDYLNGIIVKALLWTLAFVVIGTIVVIMTLDRTSNYRTSTRYSGPVNSRMPRTEGRTRRIASRTGGRRR